MLLKCFLNPSKWRWYDWWPKETHCSTNRHTGRKNCLKKVVSETFVWRNVTAYSLLQLWCYWIFISICMPWCNITKCWDTSIECIPDILQVNFFFFFKKKKNSGLIYTIKLFLARCQNKILYFKTILNYWMWLQHLTCLLNCLYKLFHPARVWNIILKPLNLHRG